MKVRVFPHLFPHLFFRAAPFILSCFFLHVFFQALPFKSLFTQCPEAFCRTEEQEWILAKLMEETKLAFGGSDTCLLTEASFY